MPKRKRVVGPGVSPDQLRAVIDGNPESNDGNLVTGAGVVTYDEEGNEIAPAMNLVTKTLRVQQVASWVLDGASTAEIVVRSTKKWRVSERTAKRYLAAARVQIEAVSAQELRSAATLALYRLTELYFAALNGGDLKTALDVVKAQNRMLGLNAPEKFETKTVTDWDSLSVAEQLNQVANILEKANVHLNPKQMN
jgi:hypothetical protein